MTYFHLDFSDERRVALVVLGKLHSDQSAARDGRPPSEEVHIFDHGGDRSATGLYLHVPSDGTATFHLRIPLAALGLVAGPQEVLGAKLGRYPDMTPLQARIQAQAAWDDTRARRGAWGRLLEAAEKVIEGASEVDDPGEDQGAILIVAQAPAGDAQPRKGARKLH